jgi:hypothetical protein
LPCPGMMMVLFVAPERQMERIDEEVCLLI